MNYFFSYKVLDNPIDNIIWFLFSLALAFLFKRFISKILGSLLYNLFRRFSKDHKGKVFNELLLAPAQWVVILFILTIGLSFLQYPSVINISILGYYLKDILLMQLKLANELAVTWLLLRMTDFFGVTLKDRADATESKMDDQLVPFIKDSVKIIIVLFSLVFILGVIFKFNVASLIAGVGIGGLAIALAAQESLKNLFASITIFLDKPFTVGDLVTITGITGTVEKVGFRSTRLRTADKTYVTLPNNTMVSSSVDNLTLRTYRRVVVNITLSFDTEVIIIKNIVEEINTFLNSFTELNEENIVRFNEFTEKGFLITITYFVPQFEFPKFMAFKENINYKIVEIVQRHGAGFAKNMHAVELTNHSIQK